MRLLTCHIENFGKLSDFSYDFTDGYNAIVLPNGAGKSTFAALAYGVKRLSPSSS